MFADERSGRAFFDEFVPRADFVLADPGGKVSVDQYGGSDANCWIFVDPTGRIAYRGGPDLKALQAAVAGSLQKSAHQKGESPVQ
ncbi:MAG: hypothetical protein FJX76_02945 [Armatimonadetes bacterium]|nr:hypothetical protein [Armatimonadota bacterium]